MDRMYFCYNSAIGEITEMPTSVDGVYTICKHEQPELKIIIERADNPVYFVIKMNKITANIDDTVILLSDIKIVTFTNLMLACMPLNLSILLPRLRKIHAIYDKANLKAIKQFEKYKI